MTSTNATRLELRRNFKCSPETLFSCWTDPRHLAKWWGPEGMNAPVIDLDVKPGGRWRTVMRNDKGEEFKVQGVYREVMPPKRLVFTWAWEDETGKPGHESIVTLTVTPEGGGAALHMVHDVLESDESRDNHNKGWTSSLNCLAAYTDELAKAA